MKMMKMNNDFDGLTPVWWEVIPGAATRSWDTNRRRFFKLFSLIFYVDYDGLFTSRWVLTREIFERFDEIPCDTKIKNEYLVG